MYTSRYLSTPEINGFSRVFFDYIAQDVLPSRKPTAAPHPISLVHANSHHVESGSLDRLKRFDWFYLPRICPCGASFTSPYIHMYKGEKTGM